MEKFRNGEIDVDTLCAELRPKAKCSTLGAVVYKEDVDRILGKEHEKSMDEDPLESSSSIDQRKVDSFAGSSRFNTNASTEECIIQCFCGTLEDDGNTVLCEKCGTWQHIECYYVNVLVPDRHLCKACEPRPQNGKDAMHRHKRLRGSFASSNNGWNHTLSTLEIDWDEWDRIFSASSYNQPPAMDDTLATFDQTSHSYHIQSEAR
jgi:hypothetical protein